MPKRPRLAIPNMPNMARDGCQPAVARLTR